MSRAAFIAWGAQTKPAPTLVEATIAHLGLPPRGQRTDDHYRRLLVALELGTEGDPVAELEGPYPDGYYYVWHQSGRERFVKPQTEDDSSTTSNLAPVAPQIPTRQNRPRGKSSFFHDMNLKVWRKDEENYLEETTDG